MSVNFSRDMTRKVDAWLVDQFGSEENVRKYSHLYTIDVDHSGLIEHEDGTVEVEQKLKLRKKTKAELIDQGHEPISASDRKENLDAVETEKED